MWYNRYTTNIPTILKVMSNYEKYTVKPPNSEHHKERTCHELPPNSRHLSITEKFLRPAGVSNSEVSLYI